MVGRDDPEPQSTERPRTVLVSVGGHALADATSLALHEEVARRLLADPEVLRRARARVAAWGDEVHPHYRARWSEVLSSTNGEICALLTADSEEARDLRQVSPFAGAIDAATRWRIWREVRRR